MLFTVIVITALLWSYNQFCKEDNARIAREERIQRLMDEEESNK